MKMPKAKAESHFERRIREAAECGLSYGCYVAQVERFGKTYEELRTAYEKSMSNL